MAKKSKQHESGSPTDGAAKAVDPALAAFATFIRSEEKKERDAKRAAKEQRARELEANRLVHAKDEAAANLKRLRSRSGVSAEERAEAETAYRAALAAVVSAETGANPEWAPPAPEPDEGAEASTDGDAGEADQADPAGQTAVADEPAVVDADTADT